ncbi:MAG: DNA gyrase subunit A [Alphaproteobacteria bacterium]|nr:DNA gyrase subunit A [Alphaproteobacteria bacterium]
MRRSYLDYAMSVIVSRALPDVRDGLKPVHRRILYSMHESGYDYNKPFRKSARIVGDVMGKYHPHGDAAIYDAMVRMAQDFSMSVPLISSQGNFGSIDGDPPVAMRYTEARLALSAHDLLDDIDKDTVNFMPNYDETVMEPVVLPARFPNILVNGAGGIAVGMATNIPPHNLGEVVDASIAYVDNPEISDEELLQIVPGPDFPTGGIIMGRSGSRSTELTGRGSIVMRGKTHIEEIRKDRWAIIITEVPYQVNKAAMITRIAELVKDKTIEGIADIRDESDRQGIRVVIEIKREFHPEIILNQLFRYTSLQTSFGANMIALNQGRPQLMNLRDMIKAFIAFREEVIRRRTIFDLGKARDRAHLLVGLAIAVENLDPVIELIRNAPNRQVAKEGLMERIWDAKEIVPLIDLIDDPEYEAVDGKCKLSEKQADAILDLRLHRLTGLERDKIHSELRELGAEIKELLSILASREKLYGIMREELVAVKEEFATPRRTTLEEVEFEHDIEDLIQREDMVVTVTNTGYIKRVPLSAYRAQKRGGKGRTGMNTHDEDYITNLFVASTHTPVLFFSSLGLVYKMKVYRLPVGSPQSTGKALINLLPLKQEERITTIMQLPENEEESENLDVMFATRSGNVRRNKLSDFIDVKANGKIAMKLDEGDTLIDVKICTDEQDILLAAKGGKSIRFPVSEVRVFSGRTSTGVRGIRLGKGDEVISMSVLKHTDVEIEKRYAYLKIAKALRRSDDVEEGASDEEATTSTVTLSDEEFQKMQADEEFILTVADTGYGKRTSAYEYRITGRGGQGVTNIDNTKRNDKVVASFPVTDTAQVMLVTDAGKLIRMPIKDVRIAGRNTMGVIMFRLSDAERVVSATCIEDYEDTEDMEEAGEGEDLTENGTAAVEPAEGNGDV